MELRLDCLEPDLCHSNTSNVSRQTHYHLQPAESATTTTHTASTTVQVPVQPSNRINAICFTRTEEDVNEKRGAGKKGEDAESLSPQEWFESESTRQSTSKRDRL